MSADQPGLDRILLILPCFNEAAVIGQLLHEIKALNASYDTVVIDDGSTDETCTIASRFAPCVRLVNNLGIGGAVQTGIKYAQRNGYELCVQIDGDGQHPPDQIADLLAAYSANPANIIVGSRYLTPGTYRSTWVRRLGSRCIALTIKMMFGGTSVTDPTSGMRLMDKKAIALFATAYPHDYPEPISIAWAIRHRLTIREHPVEMRAREHGLSSIRRLRTLTYMLRVIFYVVCARFQRNPM
jgi:glycosyltransferase involved in cell wall biosynthesis